MQNLVNIITGQIIIMFILMMIGLLLFKIKLIDKTGISQISNIVLYVLSPAIMLRSFINTYSADNANKVLWALIVSIILVFIPDLIMRLTIKDKYSTLQFATLFTNSAFIGIPLIKATLGNEYVTCVSIYNAMLLIYTWTRGITLTSGNKNDASIKKIFTNPAIWVIVIGLPLFFLNIHIPEIVTTTLDTIGNMNLGFSMMVLGTYLYKLNFSDLFKQTSTYSILLLRLIIMPILSILLCKLLNIDSGVALTLIIAEATPVGAAFAIFAQKFNKDYKYRAGLVGLSTLLSLLTIPLIVYIAQSII